MAGGQSRSARPVSVRPILALCASALLWLTPWARAEPASERFPLPDASRPGRPIDRLAEKAAASRDSYPAEAAAEELHASLRSLGEAFRSGDIGAAAILADELLGRPPGRPGREPTVVGLERWKAHAAELPALDRDRFLAQIGHTVSKFDRIRVAEFHITEVSVGTADSGQQAKTQVHFELTGPTSSGGRAQMVGDWSMAWAKSGGSWEVREWHWDRTAWAAAEQALFADITEEALGKNASYRQQLLPGVDEWRSSTDAALGIDVFGHHGVSVGDVDSDGDADLYISQPSGLPNRLLRNDGDLQFTDVTDVSGTGALDSTSMSVIADVDNDSDQDLVLVGASKPMLLRNDGTGRFELAPGTFRFASPNRAQLTSAAMADYDRDGNLDLYVCAYRHQGAGSAHGPPAPYHDANNGPANTLFRNRGDGTFEDVTQTSGMDQNNRRFSFAASWGDFDSDGWPDLYVANDFGRNNLYRNQGDGTFSDVAASAGVEDIGAGMSAAWLDHDLDGRLDLYVGNMWSSAGQRITGEPAFAPAGGAGSLASYRRHAKGNSLFRGVTGGSFEDVSELSGTAAGRWAWSSDALDLNGDGYDEIYIANGYITNSDTQDL